MISLSSACLCRVWSVFTCGVFKTSSQKIVRRQVRRTSRPQWMTDHAVCRNATYGCHRIIGSAGGCGCNIWLEESILSFLISYTSKQFWNNLSGTPFWPYWVGLRLCSKYWSSSHAKLNAMSWQHKQHTPNLMSCYGTKITVPQTRWRHRTKSIVPQIYCHDTAPNLLYPKLNFLSAPKASYSKFNLMPHYLVHYSTRIFYHLQNKSPQDLFYNYTNFHTTI